MSDWAGQTVPPAQWNKTLAFENLSAGVAALVAHRLEWTEFRAAQPLVLEAVGSGENLLLMGPSGSGKSTAAMLAILDSLMRNPGRAPAVLYLTDDAHDSAWFTELCQAAGLRAEDANDFGANPRAEKPEVVFLSPSHLEPQLTKGHDWTGLRLVVLDDLSSVVSDTSGAHLNAVLERLYQQCQADPQRVALSTSEL